LRLIILEDNPMDAELVLLELRTAGYDPHADIVCTAEEFRPLLSPSIDLILSDYSMPQFDAPSALRILQRSPYDIPFIVISGTIGEDTAVAVMRDGAYDFLLKDRLSRLGVAIESALRLCELRRRSRESEESLRKMFRAVEQAADSIVVTDRNGVIEYVNPAFLDKTGYDRSEIIGRTPAILRSGRHDRSFYTRLWTTIESGKVFRAEFINRKKNGETFAEHQAISPVFDESGTISYFISTGQDITEQRRIEHALRTSEQRYVRLIESALDAIFTLSLDGTLTSLNPAFETITGWNRVEWIGRPFLDLLHPDDQPEALSRFHRTMEGEHLPLAEYRVRCANDGIAVMEVLTMQQFSGQTIDGIFGIARNITERKHFEEQIRQAQKMESIGTLAGGIAHDFNNILGIILACSTLQERLRPEDPHWRTNQVTIRKTVDRGAMLVRQILTFARKTEPQLSSVKVNDIIEEIRTMLTLTIPKTITIDCELAPDIPAVLADPNQIHQTLLNLCVNARDAVLDRERLVSRPGIITIRSAFHDGNSGGMPSVEISVSDNGTGMDLRTKERIFDPFFTTKEKGKGTGLGLAVVYGIIHGLHGTVRVESEVGVGTTFILCIPVQGTPFADVPAVAISRSVARSGNETILMVEDESSLLDLARIFIEDAGYRLLSAQNGSEGVEVFRQHSEEVDLVFTDFGLPGMDGGMMLERIRSIRADVRMVIASGYLEPEQRNLLTALGVHAVVQKPYECDEMLSILRTVLDARQERSI
ncbi:MAG: PAS domain S-box protein, partial [Bacteroidetes bacterium]|nr:PAS domain S-box protein [Bacteroidota bacterium]